MQKSSCFFLLISVLLSWRIQSQVAPVYGNSLMFETNLVQTVIPSTQATSPYNFIITPSSLITMSTLAHRRPFISISSLQRFQTDSSNHLYLLSQITYTATSLTIALDFTIVSSTIIYSWTYNSPIKFYYMVIDTTFPDTYICGQLDIVNSMTNLANQPDSKTSNQNLNTWIGSNVVSLSSTDTKFIYAITQMEIQLTSPSDKYSISLKFVPTSNVNFDVTVSTLYKQKILLLRVSLFIYSISVFNTYFIKIVNNFYISPSLSAGISTTFQSYAGWNVYPGMQLIIGWAGMQFSGQSVMGFQFNVDTSLISTSLNLQVTNIQMAIPKLEVTIFSISQLKCPNGQGFVDVAITQCYVTCPIGTYNDVAPILTTTLTKCLLCTIVNCVSCTSATVCTQCASGFLVAVGGGSCAPCSTGYDPQCITCDQTQCLTCAVGYFYRASTLACQLLSSVVCGDSDWVYELQECDDANINSNDGCSSNCKIEADYACLIADQLLSGASFCKYSIDFYLEFISLEKDPSSNTAHFFFELKPSTFNYWTQLSVEMLLNPVTIVDSDTGNIQTIPVNSLNIIFTKNGNINSVEIIVDYGTSNLDGNFLQFNIQPALTGVSSITHLATQNNLHLKVDSQKSGVYLFGYDQETYNFQGMVSMLSLATGLIALFMMILGFCVPAGKLIILQALAVVQISYFSLMQFKKIPPTFIGLKNLMFSNGFNIQSLFGSTSHKFQDVYRLMGLQNSAFSNDNISLIVFLILPFLIGLIGHLIGKCLTPKVDDGPKLEIPPQTLPQKCQPPLIEQKITEPKVIGQYNLNGDKNQRNYITFSKKQYLDQDSRFMVESVVQQIFKLDSKRTYDKKYDSIIYQLQNTSRTNENQEKKSNDSFNQKPKNDQKFTLSMIIYQRILYEMTFYGIIVTSYLSWVSILHSFSFPQTGKYILLVLILISCGCYAFLFIRIDEKFVQFNQFLTQEKATNKIFPQKHFICANFGQFSQVPTQITQLDQQRCSKHLKKIYMIFIFERLLSSILVVVLPSFITMTSAILIAVYFILILGLMLLYRKGLFTRNCQLQGKELSKQTVRIDLLQKNKDEKLSEIINKSIFSYLHQNYVLRQGINMSTIIIIQVLYLYTSIMMNSGDPTATFTTNTIIIKVIPITVLGILMASLLFNLFLWVWELKQSKVLQKSKILFYSLFPSMFQTQLQKMRIKMQHVAQTEKEEAQCIKMINNFMEKSNVFQSKENPFLGIQQKRNQQAGDALLDVLKLEQKDKFEIPFDVKKRKSWLIEKYWVYM